MTSRRPSVKLAADRSPEVQSVATGTALVDHLPERSPLPHSPTIPSPSLTGALRTPDNSSRAALPQSVVLPAATTQQSISATIMDPCIDRPGAAGYTHQEDMESVGIESVNDVPSISRKNSTSSLPIINEPFTLLGGTAKKVNF